MMDLIGFILIALMFTGFGFMLGLVNHDFVVDAFKEAKRDYEREQFEKEMKTGGR